MNIFSQFALIYTLALSFSTCMLANEPVEHTQTECLKGRLNANDKRYPSFLLVLELLKERQAKVLVETGTARFGDKNFVGDGGSTIIFGDWASRSGAKLTTVDISSVAVERARSSTWAYNDSIEYVCSDSILLLQNLKQPIDFLYLDSFDFDFNDPLPSQRHHLKEIIAAYSLLHADSVVMIDDCHLPFGGKGCLVIEFLLAKGWIVLYDGYQTILVQ